MKKLIPLLALVIMGIIMIFFYHFNMHVNDNIHACAFTNKGMLADPIPENRVCHCVGRTQIEGENQLDGAQVTYCLGYGISVAKKWPF